MKPITLLPADIYTVINKTILTEYDKKIIMSLYEPIIGHSAVSLYFTLWNDLDNTMLMSKDYTHHHLMTILKNSLDDIKVSREALESVGLLRTYYKEDNINYYIYLLYSPLTPKEFFMHPIFNVVLYNNIGKEEYERLKANFSDIRVDFRGYEEITKMLNMTFKSISGNTLLEQIDDVKDRLTNSNILETKIDFDLLISSIPKSVVSDNTFNKKTRDLINELAFIYNYDTLKMTEMIRLVLNEKGMIDKEELKNVVRKYYQYDNTGALPTIIYRSQPEYLKTHIADESNRSKMIQVFESTSPYDFLKSKYKGAKPPLRDLRIIEYLVVDLGLTPGVVNVLIDYVLRVNDKKLTRAYIETIAGEWKRLNIESVNEAMTKAEESHKKYKNKTVVKTKEIPVWFDKNIEREKVSDEELAELENMLEEFK